MDVLSQPVATSGSIDKWDRDHSWHPFTQMQEYLVGPPLHVERGEGCWLLDTAGRRYLDGNASVWTNVHGHNDPDLNAALVEQLQKVAHSTYLGLSHPKGAELGRRLVKLGPEPLARVVFSDNGSSAIEIALKQSFQFWQMRGAPRKRLIVGMEGGYHGDTFGAMAAGNSMAFHGRFDPWLFDSRRFRRPVCRESAGTAGEVALDASLESLREILSTEKGEVAAVIIEPSVQGPSGMQLQPKGFLKEVERLCREFDCHLICDEVFVGFGRLGALSVCAEQGVSPDFLCFAKGLSAGYLPLAATLTTEEIYAEFLGPFSSGSAFFHGHTFTGNPLAAAVALRSIEKLETMIDSGDLSRRMDYFGERLRRRFADHPNVSALRQRGFAAAVDLRPDGRSGVNWQPDDRIGQRVCLQARERGLLLRPLLDSILLVPPLVISRNEIDFLIDGLEDAMGVAIPN